MVRRPAGRCRINAIEPEAAQFQRIHEHIDRANRIALVNPIIEAFRQQRRLLAIRPLNETLHHFPRRFSNRIIAPMGFSHSLGQNRKYSLRADDVRSTPESGLKSDIRPCPKSARTGSRGIALALQTSVMREAVQLVVLSTL